MDWVRRFFQRPESPPSIGTGKRDSTRLARFDHLCGIALHRETPRRPLSALAKAALRRRSQIAHPAKTLAGIYQRKLDYHVNAATHRD